ncbi:hypothetical protein Fmac_032629 [Flemingia macrophylla]|uniref:Uncharacterized protein n=1 Tax=Flemingia macrophylla TaxID=520843 RepID=A0ABD1L5W2_9FABA
MNLRKYISCLRPERMGKVGALLDTIAEATILTSGVDFSVFSILVHAAGQQEGLVQPGSRPIASAERDDIAICAADCRLIAFKSVDDSTRDEPSDDGGVAVSDGGARGEVDGGVATGDGLGDVVVDPGEAAVGPPREAAGRIAEGTEDVPRDGEVGDGAGGEKLGGFGFEHSESKSEIFGIVQVKGTTIYSHISFTPLLFLSTDET